MGKASKLSYDRRESIARECFQSRGPIQGDEIHGLCPFHEDSNPSFSYNIAKDVFNCLACSATGDLIKLWSKANGSGNLTEDFKSFCQQYDIDMERGSSKSTEKPANKSEKPATERKKIEKSVSTEDLKRAWEAMPPLPENMVAGLIRTRGWSKEVIERLDLRLQTMRYDKSDGQVKQIKTPDRIAMPVFDIDGKLKNIRCYKPGGGSIKIYSFGPGCGDARLFPAKPDPMGAVLLVEGESDCICALSHGFNAITQTSKTKYWPPEQAQILAGRDVVIAYDADQPGQKYARHAAESLHAVAKSVKTLVWPDWMGRTSEGKWPEDHGQDLTDYFAKHAKTADELQRLIREARPWIVEPGGATSDPLAFFDSSVNGNRLSFKPRLLADRVIAEMDIITDPQSGLVYRWNKQFFETFPEDHIEKYCIDLLGDEAQQSRVKDATYQAKRLTVIPHGRATNDRIDWVCLVNGMINLRSCEIKPHDQDYYATYQLPVVFDPARAGRCERWLQFLSETIQTPEPILQIQEFFGYCLTREVRFEKALLLLGPGADGKSKAISVLEAIVGQANCSAVSFQDLEDQFHRSSLYGKLLNISTEVGSKAMESAYFKAIVSGDPISAAFKHQDAFHFRPVCKLIFAGNRLPRILDNSDGPFRRLLPIEFKRQFLDDGDTALLEKLMAELSDIFQWALVGLHRLWEQGHFTDCEETRRLLMAHRRANNPVLCFVEDECLLGELEKAGKKDIYERYKKYSGMNGYSTLGKENFFRELYAAVANLKQHRPRMEGVPTYIVEGIGLKPE